MTPQQANDYGHLPEHPRPSGPHRPPEGIKTPNLTPLFLGLVGWFIVGALFFAVFHAGRMTAKRVDEAKIEQAFKTGLTLGGICAHDPTMAACSPESLRSGGVL